MCSLKKDIREDFEIIQEVLAKILGVESSTYSGWETEKNTISLKKLCEFCDYYNINIDYITGLSKDKSKYISNYVLNIKYIEKNLERNTI